MSDLKDQVNERRSGIDRRTSLENRVKDLRGIIFKMLNFTNMYTLILDQNLIIRFANSSLAIDLGFDGYSGLTGKCWLDFVPEREQNIIEGIHKSIANGTNDWEKYREFKNRIRNINGEEIETYWFNSHINTDYNWTFSFGIRKRPIVQDDVNMDSIRNYYRDIINKDREMIKSMREVIGFRDDIVNTCKTDFADNIYT